jgi:hypothetical protein
MTAAIVEVQSTLVVAGAGAGATAVERNKL